MYLAAGSSGGSFLPLLFIILIFGAMYFLFIRPQQRRNRDLQSMQSKLGTGDEDRVTAAYRIAFGRSPEKPELDLALRFLKLPTKPDHKLTRWQQYAQVLLASNEMMYVD